MKSKEIPAVRGGVSERRPRWYVVAMTRKQKEAHVRRAMAAGRRPRPVAAEAADTDLLHDESTGPTCPMALNEAKDVRVTGPRGA